MAALIQDARKQLAQSRVALHRVALQAVVFWIAVSGGIAWTSAGQSPRLARALEKPMICTGTAGQEARVLPCDESEPGKEWHVVQFVPDRLLKGTLETTPIEVRYQVPRDVGYGVLQFPSVPTKGRALLCLTAPQGDDPSYILPLDDSCAVRLSPSLPPLAEGQEPSVMSIMTSELLASLRFEGAEETDICLAGLIALRMYRIRDADILGELQLSLYPKYPWCVSGPLLNECVLGTTMPCRIC